MDFSPVMTRANKQKCVVYRDYNIIANKSTQTFFQPVGLRDR